MNSNWGVVSLLFLFLGAHIYLDFLFSEELFFPPTRQFVINSLMHFKINNLELSFNHRVSLFVVVVVVVLRGEKENKSYNINYWRV